MACECTVHLLEMYYYTTDNSILKLTLRVWQIRKCFVELIHFSASVLWAECALIHMIMLIACLSSHKPCDYSHPFRKPCQNNSTLSFFLIMVLDVNCTACSALEMIFSCAWFIWISSFLHNQGHACNKPVIHNVFDFSVLALVVFVCTVHNLCSCSWQQTICHSNSEHSFIYSHWGWWERVTLTNNYN